MSLTEIIKNYEIGKNKKGVVILCVPKRLSENVEDVLVVGYVSCTRNENTLFYIYDIDDLSNRTGLDFSYKY